MSQPESVKVEATEISPAVRSLSVEVAAARVDKAFARSYQELSKTVQVKGFRRGKVPRSIVTKMYGGAMAEEIERTLVSETLMEAVENADLRPLTEPDIEAATPAEGSAFRYTARFEVRPPIELPELSELVGKRVPVTIADEDVEAQLHRLRDGQAQLLEEPAEVEAAQGHVLHIDFVGRVDGEIFEGGTGQGMEVEIGSDRLVPGFEEQLVGAKVGDDVQVNVTFPDDYNAEALKGKDAVFEVHVASVRRRQVPELDDEFAKDLGDFDDLAALEAKVRDDIMASRVEMAADGLKRSVMESLVGKTEFEVPPGIIERELHGQISAMQRRYKDQVPEELLQGQLARMHEEGRPGAEQKVRETFLLAQLAEDRGLEVADEEVDTRLDEMAEAQGMEPQLIRDMAKEQGWRDAIGAELLEQRAFDILVSEATLEEVSEEDEPDSGD